MVGLNIHSCYQHLENRYTLLSNDDHFVFSGDQEEVFLKGHCFLRGPCNKKEQFMRHWELMFFDLKEKVRLSYKNVSDVNWSRELGMLPDRLLWDKSLKGLQKWTSFKKLFNCNVTRM